MSQWGTSSSAVGTNRVPKLPRSSNLVSVLKGLLEKFSMPCHPCASQAVESLLPGVYLSGVLTCHHITEVQTTKEHSQSLEGSWQSQPPSRMSSSPQISSQIVH